MIYMMDMTLGQRIRYLREEKELTQRQVAEAIEVASSTMTLYETDRRAPSYAILSRFAQFFAVSTDYLLGLSEKRGEVLNRNELITLIGKEYAEKLTKETLELINTIENARQILTDKEIGFAIHQAKEYKKNFSE